MSLPIATPPDFWFPFQAFAVEDIETMRRFANPAPEADPNCITDFFGMRISAECEPGHAGRLGEVLTSPPFPGDTIFADGIEYAALACALRGVGRRFAMLELGAGYGPWITIGALCAQRAGCEEIILGAVEADPYRFGVMRRHLAHNGLVAASAPKNGRDGELCWDLRQQPVWPNASTVLWPGGDLEDSGRQASELEARNDYRGLPIKGERVETVALADLLRSHTRIDFVHMDVQGSESELVPSALEALSETTRVLFVGTHSRRCEGIVLEAMFSAGWHLEREEPCVFRGWLDAPTLEGKTVRDGGLVWRNPRL